MSWIVIRKHYMQSITDEFESALARAQQKIETAREDYRALEKFGAVPDELVETFSELEREIGELDEEIDVSNDDLREAEEAVERATLLESVVTTVRDRERSVIEADVSRLRLWIDGYTRANRKHTLSNETQRSLHESERFCDMMEQLLGVQRHEKVRSNDRFSPAVVDLHLRSLDRRVRADLSDEVYADVCLGVAEDLLAEIHDVLRSISDKNPQRTAFADSLRAVKSYVSTTETALTSTADDGADSPGTTARIALEGALMLQYLTSRVQADQELATALADVIVENDLDVDLETTACAEKADVASLMNAVIEVIQTEVELSASTRLERLLKEHDGSVVRTATATDFDVEAIFGLLNTMYENHEITDVRVMFD